MSNKKLLVVFGALSGWITSLLVLKIGKSLAFVIGAVMVAMEFNNEHECFKLDWKQINERFISTPDNFKELNNIWAYSTVGDKREDRFSTFVLSFIGGILMAIGCR